MEFDETEKNAIAHFFNCLFKELTDLFQIKGGLTKEFVKSALSTSKKEITGIAGFCPPTHNGNLIIVSFADDTRSSYHVGGQQAIMSKIPLLPPHGTPLESTISSMTS